jgi:hypothetical protein
MKTLRKGEFCPLHKSYFCCGRAKPTKKQKAKGLTVQPGVRRIDDEFHPRGYRERCSVAELRRRKHKLMAAAELTCFYCGGDLRQSDYREIALCHKEPKGMGGARHDDHFDNLVLAHASCNLENGSRRPGKVA